MVQIKKVLLISLCIFPPICPQPIELNEGTYRGQVKTWVNNHVLDYKGNQLISDTDLQLILNLVFFSFARSYINLKAQQISHETLNAVWHGWQNIAQTRLNPSNLRPYKISNGAKQKNLALFWKIHDEHERVCSTYAQAVELIVDGDALTSPTAKTGVALMRQASRLIVSLSFVNAQEQLALLFSHENNQDTSICRSTEHAANRSIPFLSFLSSYIPQLAINTFVNADALSTTIAEEAWNGLEIIKRIGDITWQTLETERASFYLALYKAVYTETQKLKKDAWVYEIIIDSNGLIPDFAPKYSLPVPDMLLLLFEN